MKSAQEWMCEWFGQNIGRNRLTGFFEEIQQDAYRSGLLKGLQVFGSLPPDAGLDEFKSAVEAEANKGVPTA